MDFFRQQGEFPLQDDKFVDFEKQQAQIQLPLNNANSRQPPVDSFDKSVFNRVPMSGIPNLQIPKPQIYMFMPKQSIDVVNILEDMKKQAVEQTNLLSRLVLESQENRKEQQMRFSEFTRLLIGIPQQVSQITEPIQPDKVMPEPMMAPLRLEIPVYQNHNLENIKPLEISYTNPDNTKFTGVILEGCAGKVEPIAHVQEVITVVEPIKNPDELKPVLIESIVPIKGDVLDEETKTARREEREKELVVESKVNLTEQKVATPEGQLLQSVNCVPNTNQKKEKRHHPHHHHHHKKEGNGKGKEVQNEKPIEQLEKKTIEQVEKKKKTKRKEKETAKPKEKTKKRDDEKKQDSQKVKTRKISGEQTKISDEQKIPKLKKKKKREREDKIHKNAPETQHKS